MRPIKLRMRYFGPYEDEVIDFKKFENRIFLISGKTGSGKTTILDAIIYALYGETSGAERDWKDIHSDFFDTRKKGGTFVDFTFENQQKIYRIVRKASYQGKSKKLDRAKEELVIYGYDAKGNEIIYGNGVAGGKKTEGKEYLENLIHINAEQFRKIFVLPQGKFSDFLKAKSADKEKILRSLFDIEIFVKWGKLFDEKTKLLKKEVDLLKEKRNQIIKQDNHIPVFNDWKILAKEKLIQLKKREQNKDFIQAQENIKKRTFELERAKTLLHDFEKKAQVSKKIAILNLNANEIQQLRQKIADVTWAIRQEKDITLYSKNQKRQVKINNEMVDLDDKLKKTSDELSKFKQNMKKLSLTEVGVEKLKEELVILKLDLKKYQAYEKIRDELSEVKKAEYVFEQKRHTLNEQLISLKKDYAENTVLLESFSNLDISILKNQTQLDEIERKKEQYLAVVMLKKAVKKAETEYALLIKKEKQVHLSYIKQRKILDELNEQKLLNQIAQLAKKLKANQACPLCGSKKHPNPAFKLASIDENKYFEVKQIASNLNEEIIQLNTSTKLTKQVLLEKNKELASKEEFLLQEQDDLEKFNLKLVDEEKRLKEKSKQLLSFREQKIKLTEKLEKLSSQMMDIETELSKKEDKAKKSSERKIVLNAKILEFENLKNKSKKELVLEIQNIKMKLNDFCEQKTSIEEGIETQKIKQSKIQTKLEQLQIEMEQKKEEEYKLQRKIEDTLSSYNKKYTIEKVTKLIEEEKELKTYSNKVYEFDQQLLALTIEKKQLEQKTRKELRPDIEHLQDKLDKAIEIQKRLQEKKSEITFEILQLEEKLKKAGSLNKEYESKWQKLNQWSNLNKAMNATAEKGGNRFGLERFVLQQYFKRVLNHANVRLSELSQTRYSFEIDENVYSKSKTGLEIVVLDSYTGKLRAAKTLSGGESFIASLALALGLSEVIQNENGGIEMKALFIDEGFGSLDNDSLDAVIESLQRIEGKNRMIGIISHVTSLFEKIGIELKVTSRHGKSRTKIID